MKCMKSDVMQFTGKNCISIENVDQCVKRMTSMLDSDQFKRENFTFMRKKKK